MRRRTFAGRCRRRAGNVRQRIRDVPETPLERTISTDSPVNLDEADPIAEADFHMAYGLYDQAADLLSNCVDRGAGPQGPAG